MKLDRLRSMPPLPHWVHKGKLAYDPGRSEVLRFIGNDLKLMEAVFRAAAARGFIRYDEASNTWRGVPEGDGGQDR